MIATRLSSVWQVAGVAAAALCCYLVSQSVAAERTGLSKVDRQIAQANDEIARLQTELGTRGRMAQLESWNTKVLELKAPRPAQFVADGTQLVALYATKGRPALQLDPNIVAQQGDTTKVTYQPAPAPAAPSVAPVPNRVPDAPDVAPPRALLQTAAFVRPKPQALAPHVQHVSATKPDHSAEPADASDAQPLLRTATFVRAKPQRLAPEAPSIERAAYRPAAARPIKLASLLPSDIADIAASERGKGRRAKADR